jgi:hypothetical protein
MVPVLMLMNFGQRLSKMHISKNLQKYRIWIVMIIQGTHQVVHLFGHAIELLLQRTTNKTLIEQKRKGK